VITTNAGHLVLSIVRDLQLPLEGVQGGYLVYRTESETLYALDESLAVTGRRALAADDVPAVLAQLYHAGAVVPYSPADEWRLMSTIGAMGMQRPHARSGPSRCRTDIIVCRVLSLIIAPIVARPGELLVIRPAAEDSLAVTNEAGTTESRRAAISLSRLSGDLRRLMLDDAIRPLTSVDERLLLAL
jgi:hypothetical protein